MAAGRNELSASGGSQRQHPQRQSEYGHEAGAEGAAASVLQEGTVPRGQTATHRVRLTHKERHTFTDFKHLNMFLKIVVVCILHVVVFSATLLNVYLCSLYFFFLSNFYFLL